MRTTSIAHADLHGNAPDKCAVALLLIDVINDFEWKGAEKCLSSARHMAARIAALKARALRSRVPVIYVNDNFGRWRSDFKSHITHCLRDDVRGHQIVKQLLPTDADYYVLKAKHSGFFETSLDLLLRHLQVRTVVLAGIASDNCVLFTASDAFLREYRIIVPRDCVIAGSSRDNARALAYMRKTFHALTPASFAIKWARLKS